MKRTAIAVGIVTAFGITSAEASAPAVWAEQIFGGEMLFYDWGYGGPQGQNAGQWESNGTFDGAAQLQTVVTQNPDSLTPDDPYTFETEFDVLPIFRDANTDAQVNFFKWGYTTVGGSTFNNMQIDADGDYLIERSDMNFNYYGVLDYQDMGDNSALPYNAPEGINDTIIDFQPYALSAATGWCGSVSASNPASLEAMAGQVKFDFGFEAFLATTPRDENGVGYPGTGEMQIVTDFQMRSYGSLEVNVDVGTTPFTFNADAVVNNTNPLDSTGELDINGDPVMITVPVLNMDGTAALDINGDPRTMQVEKKTVGGGGTDEDFYNKVSFMGGGSVPLGTWVKLIDPNGPHSNANILEVLDADDGEANTVWHQNSFAGYPFLLRADGIRILDAMDYSLFGDLSGIPASGFDESGNLINLEGNVVADLSAVPVPAAVWLFGSGLVGLIGLARRKKA